jgi:hypothetical protein
MIQRIPISLMLQAKSICQPISFANDAIDSAQPNLVTFFVRRFYARDKPSFGCRCRIKGIIGGRTPYCLRSSS